MSPIPGPKPRPGAPCKPKPGPKPKPKLVLPLQRGPPLPSVPVERSARRGSSRSSRSAPGSAGRKAGSAAQFGEDTLHITVFEGAFPQSCRPSAQATTQLVAPALPAPTGSRGKAHPRPPAHREESTKAASNTKRRIWSPNLTRSRCICGALALCLVCICL